MDRDRDFRSGFIIIILGNLGREEDGRAAQQLLSCQHMPRTQRQKNWNKAAASSIDRRCIGLTRRLLGEGERGVVLPVPFRWHSKSRGKSISRFHRSRESVETETRHF